MGYKVGDKVRIIGNSNCHGFEKGDVVTITMPRSFAKPTYVCHECIPSGGGAGWYVRDYDMELVESQKSEYIIRIYGTKHGYDVAKELERLGYTDAIRCAKAIDATYTYSMSEYIRTEDGTTYYGPSASDFKNYLESSELVTLDDLRAMKSTNGKVIKLNDEISVRVKKGTVTVIGGERDGSVLTAEELKPIFEAIAPIKTTRLLGCATTIRTSTITVGCQEFDNSAILKLKEAMDELA